MVSQRDKVWATVLNLIEVRPSITVSAVRDAIDDPPARRTIQNSLSAMEELGYLASRGGSGSAPREYFPQSPESPLDPGGYTPKKHISQSAFPYPGSKSGALADWIIDLLPEHDTYVSVFGGAAGVLYQKPRSKYEVYNDVDDDLTQFFTILRDRPDDLAEWLQAVPYSRSQYEEWASEFYRGIRPSDPIERAGRFFSLRYMQFAGVANSINGFKVRARRSPARTFDNARKRIHELGARFSQVTIENEHYQQILNTYDDPSVDVVFYIDPPYRGAGYQYGTEFDHDQLAKSLATVDNDWILSCSEIHPELTDYNSRSRQSRHAMKRVNAAVDEILVANFEFPDPPEDPGS